MFKKLITLAATTAMLASNAAAQAINTARSAVKGLAGSPSATEETKPFDGTKIQPSIPPMPPMEKAQPAERKAPEKKATARKASSPKATPHKSAAKPPRARKSTAGAKATHRKPKAKRHASK